MATLNLAQAATDKKSIQFYLGRASAIQEYATLEQTLCNLFSALLGTPPQLGAIVFFKITSARYRNDIIGRLLKKTNRSQFTAFWSGAEKEIRKLDQKRNEIVHWNIVTNIEPNETGGEIKSVDLIPPNIWDFDSESPKVSLVDLAVFCAQADFVIRSLNKFHLHVFHNHNLPEPWPDIFQRPLVYPPPTDHPWFQTPTTQPPPPQSSEA